MLLPETNPLFRKRVFDVRYFLLFFPNSFKMRQSLIVFNFWWRHRVIPSVCTSYIINYLCNFTSVHWMWRGCEDQYEDLKPLNSLFLYFFSQKCKLITCCFCYVGSFPTQGMKIKLLVLEKIQQCFSKYSYAVLYD
jgi:hypothetical protein